MADDKIEALERAKAQQWEEDNGDYICGSSWRTQARDWSVEEALDLDILYLIFFVSFILFLKFISLVLDFIFTVDYI